LALLGSNVAELTLVLSVIVLPEAAVTFTTTVIVMEPPEARLAAVQVTLPKPPGAGVVHVPELTEALLKVVPRGTTVSMLRLLAGSGPLFVATIA
jgi:hypothetical protein